MLFLMQLFLSSDVFPYDARNPFHFSVIVMVHLVAKYSGYPNRLNVLIKESTAINIYSNPLC